MKQYFVINADDLGFSPGTNAGIENAHKQGILTSASMMATGPSFQEAVALCKRNPRLGVGVHLSLTLGTSVLPRKRIPDLVDEGNYLHSNSLALLLKTLLMPNRMRKQITEELDAQIEKIQDAGITLDHLDSQYHVHSMPLIFSVVCKLGKKHGVMVIRNPREPLWVLTKPMNMFKWFVLQMYGAINELRGVKPRITPKFYGILHTRAMKASTIKDIMRRHDEGVVEILTHPGVFDIEGVPFEYNRQGIIPFLASRDRRMEMEMLMKKDLKAFIEKNGIHVMTFAKAVEYLKRKPG